MQNILITLVAILSLARADDWKPWSENIERIHPITDANGHGPDIGSDEWANALSKKLGIMDAEGHGPDIKTGEWRKAIEKKLNLPQRELLSSHSTVAKFVELKDQRCMGRTSLCPDRCGHSGKIAVFEITEYLAYQKLGQYGDPRQEKFQILIEDNQGNAKIDAGYIRIIESFKPGAMVKLSWNHDYVTKDNAGYPDRIITHLQPLTSTSQF